MNTPYFSGDIKPARPGVYLRRHYDGVNGYDSFYSKWNGKHWLLNSPNFETASNVNSLGVSAWQNIPWCGEYKLTDWEYGAPEHVGWYLTKYYIGGVAETMLWWNGSHWLNEEDGILMWIQTLSYKGLVLE